MRGYKWLTNKMKSSHGNITWKLNEWQIHKGKIELCWSGFHACKTAFDSLRYIYGDKLVEIEAENIIESDDKFVSSKMRVVKELPAKEIMLKFAIECAKRVLYNFEERYPGDNRSREAIKTAENILMGAIFPPTDAANATRSAAYVATYAAFVARSAVDTAELATYAATIYATRSMAYAAANAVSSTSGLAVERKWQSEKLQEIIEEYSEIKS